MKLYSFIIPSADWREIPKPLSDYAKTLEEALGMQDLLGFGAANGYVAIPKEHPLYGLSYNSYIKVKDINKIVYNGSIFGLFSNATDSNREDNEISIEMLVNVHGGITLAKPVEKCTDWRKYFPKGLWEKRKDYWLFGFDTGHAGDNSSTWTIEAVKNETERFKQELINCIAQLDMVGEIKEVINNVSKVIRKTAGSRTDGESGAHK